MNITTAVRLTYYALVGGVRSTNSSDKDFGTVRGLADALWSPGDIVPDDHPTLHHEAHSLHLGNIREWISRNRDDVCELALLNGADVLLDTVIQHVGRVDVCRLQRLCRRQSPLHEPGELVCLLAMWNYE